MNKRRRLNKEEKEEIRSKEEENPHNREKRRREEEVERIETDQEIVRKSQSNYKTCYKKWMRLSQTLLQVKPTEVKKIRVKLRIRTKRLLMSQHQKKSREEEADREDTEDTEDTEERDIEKMIIALKAMNKIVMNVETGGSLEMKTLSLLQNRPKLQSKTTSNNLSPPSHLKSKNKSKKTLHLSQALKMIRDNLRMSPAKHANTRKSISWVNSRRGSTAKKDSRDRFSSWLSLVSPSA